LNVEQLVAVSSTGLTGRSSIPETPVREPRRRGVLAVIAMPGTTPTAVIASEAKQSIVPLAEAWIASSLRSSQ